MRHQFWQSVATPLVVVLLVAATVGLLTVGALELARGRRELRLDLTKDLSLTITGIHEVTRAMSRHQGPSRPDPDQLEQMLQVLTADQPIPAVRLAGPGLPRPVGFGRPARFTDHPLPPQTWAFTEQGVVPGQNLSLDQPTRVRVSFVHDQAVYTLDLIVDGPAAYARMRQGVLRRFGLSALFLCTMTLLGLLLLRRWLLAPIGQVVQLARHNGEPEAFRRLARGLRGEIAGLADTLARMLENLDQTTHRLRERERAFAELYQFAPTALVSIDLRGQITQANQRAAELLSVDGAEQIVGRPWGDFVYVGDQPRLQQAIDRLVDAPASRCHIRVSHGETLIDTTAEARGVRDEAGMLRSVRLSIMDVTDAIATQRAAARESRQMSLAIDHLALAVLFVDCDGRIAACNQPMAGLLHTRPELVLGQAFTHDDFWDALSLAQPRLAIHRLQQIDADHRGPAQELVQTRHGTYLFRGSPVHDATGHLVGRLWVLEEAGPQDQTRQLVQQQAHQLDALRQVSRFLHQVDSVEDLLEQAVTQLFDVLGVEAVGIALRSGGQNREGWDRDRRTRQLIHRGSTQTLYAPHRELVRAIEDQLLPHTLAQGEVTYWSDLDLPSRWARAATGAGLTCLAVAPLRGGDENQGLIWIARRAGERLDNHHLHLLETLAPLVSAHLHTTRTLERMYQLRLTDRVTELPNHEQLIQAITRRLAQSSVVAARPQPHADPTLALLVLSIAPAPGSPAPPSGTLGHTPDAIPEAELEAALMRSVARRLRNLCRQSAFLARLDGPRFAIVSPWTPPGDARAMADRLRRALTTPPPPEASPPEATPPEATPPEAYSPDVVGEVSSDASLTEPSVRLSVGISYNREGIASPYHLLDVALGRAEVAAASPAEGPADPGLTLDQDPAPTQRQAG